MGKVVVVFWVNGSFSTINKMTNVVKIEHVWPVCASPLLTVLAPALCDSDSSSDWFPFGRRINMQVFSNLLVFATIHYRHTRRWMLIGIHALKRHSVQSYYFFTLSFSINISFPCLRYSVKISFQPQQWDSVYSCR